LKPQMRPLENIRVIDMSWVGAGPLCASYLARMGAEVIKVETRRRLDFCRSMPFVDGIPGVERGGLFLIINAGKRSCTIDMAKPEGAKLIKNLVKVSDVVIEAFSADTLEKWDLGYSTLRELKPELIMASISAFGRTGPQRGYVAYGRNLHGASGLTALIGYTGGPPRGLTGQWSDTLAGMTATFAILACLYHSRKTGTGQYIDLSMCEATTAALCEPIIDYQMNHRIWERVGNQSQFAAPHNCYHCKGYDQWVAIVVSTDEEWEGFCDVMGNPDWTRAEKFSNGLRRWQNQLELDKLVSNWTRSYTPYEAMDILQEAGIPAGVILDTEGLANDQHLNKRNFFTVVDHPEVGKRKILSLPWNLSDAVDTNNHHAPLLGEDNDYVFRELLHIPDDEIARLIEEKVIY